MTAISTAVGLERQARVSGYKIKKGFFDNNTSNLPQLIAVFGEANDANQGGLSTTKREVTSAQEAGEIYGYGSPIHQMLRILRPITGGGVRGIPTVVFPQASDAVATATSLGLTVTGTASKNAVHTLVINGRRGIDFQNYEFSVVKDETPTQIADKISTAINSVLGSPVVATASLGVVTITTKWKGATSAKLNVDVDNQGVNAGLTYTESNRTEGSGTVSLADSFTQFGSEWYTTVLNPYSDKLGEFEQFNGVPYGDNPTGKYAAIEFKPFMSFFGSTESDKDNLIAITNAADRIDQVTNVLCPAPNSQGFDWEAASNVVTLFSRKMQDSPNLTISNEEYPDMPTPDSQVVGDMADYNNRDLLVKNGCSTVTLERGAYKVQDLVTTYHPEGETPLQYNYARNLNLDWNVKDGYVVLEILNVRDHTLLLDNQVSDAPKTVKSKQWKAVLFDYFDSLAERALVKDPEFSKESLSVEINSTNPNRFDTFFRYRRTGIARIQSTTAEAGF